MIDTQVTKHYNTLLKIALQSRGIAKQLRMIVDNWGSNEVLVFDSPTVAEEIRQSATSSILDRFPEVMRICASANERIPQSTAEILCGVEGGGLGNIVDHRKHGCYVDAYVSPEWDVAAVRPLIEAEYQAAWARAADSFETLAAEMERTFNDYRQDIIQGVAVYP